MSCQPSQRALIVIDVQNEYFAGALPIEYPDPQASLARIARAMDAARAAGIAVVVVQQTAPADSPIFARGGFGALLHETVASRPRDHYVEKSLPSALAGTDLLVWLRGRGIDRLAVAGYMTQNCVAATITHAVHEGFAVEFLADAAGSVSYENRAGRSRAEEMHRAFSVVLQSRFAAVVTTEAWIEGLAQGAIFPRDSIFSSSRDACTHTPGIAPSIRASWLLRPMQASDPLRIARWPAYPAEFAELDYALRDGGWFHELRDHPRARVFVAAERGEPIGFTMLLPTDESEAEFRIALHADHIGAGLGRTLSAQTLAIGFCGLGLARVHLVVRAGHARAIRLYEDLAFAMRGTCQRTFDGKAAEFLVMDRVMGDEI